jgi:hypothetical protein
MSEPQRSHIKKPTHLHPPMKKYLNLASALIASVKPKSQPRVIDTYGQSPLTHEQQ